MILTSLSLTDFKNIASARLEFSDKLNCLLGDNGMGKSNLLDAIHYLSLLKSMTGATDPLLVRRDAQFAMLQGRFLRRNAIEDIAIGIVPGKRKIVKRSGKEYGRLSEHIGRFPAVLVSPADMELVNGTPDERRRFVDISLSQADAKYLDALTRYSEGLASRNRMLRDDVRDGALFDAVEAGMDAAAYYLTRARAEHIAQISADHAEVYRLIGGDEVTQTGLEYAHWNGEALPAPGDMADQLARSRQRDFIMRHTTVGPHRDDILFTLSGMPLRRTASQGQQKTFTIALRMAQYRHTARCTGLKPLLLLDDIFDKLDQSRVEALVNMVASDSFGQIFITDTNRRHLDEILGRAAGQAALWSVANGEFTPMSL